MPETGSDRSFFTVEEGSAIDGAVTAAT